MESIKQTAEELFTKHPTRFTKKEKTSFIRTATDKLVEMGYDRSDIKVTEHKDFFKCRNVVVGDPSAPYVITGHYDTPGCNGFLLGTSKLVGQTGANIVMLLLYLPVFGLFSIATELVGRLIMLLTGKMDSIMMPSEEVGSLTVGPVATVVSMLLFYVGLILVMVIKNKNNRNDNTSGVLGVLECARLAVDDPELRKKCCFVLFDNEEWGLVGSAQHAAWLRKNGINTANQVVINLDCIGVGEKLVAAFARKPKNNAKRVIDALNKEGCDITVKRSSIIYMSDHANFRSAFMLSYMRKSLIGALYIPNIHSPKDKVCDIEQVERLSNCIVRTVKQ